MTDNNNNRTPLLPVRHPQQDFFVCDIFDAAPKGDMASMEHPIFSLSTKPDTRPRKYEHNGNTIEIKPSSDGVATVHDRDILIYCISQLMVAINNNQSVSQNVRFKAYDLLVATNRNTAGTGYAQLKASLERLAGTRINTNIITGGKEIFSTFGLIESATIVKETRDGRMQEIDIKLSDWVFNAINSKEVLTLHRDYFRLRKPLERKIYDLARKHCGMKSNWKIGLRLLQKKCGSYSTVREFKRSLLSIIKEDIEHNHFPDYTINYDPENEMVLLENKGTMQQQVVLIEVPTLDGDIYEMARALAPGWDVRHLENEWRNWIKEKPRNAEAAFLGFCKKWFEKRGAPK